MDTFKSRLNEALATDKDLFKAQRVMRAGIESGVEKSQNYGQITHKIADAMSQALNKKLDSLKVVAPGEPAKYKSGSTSDLIGHQIVKTIKADGWPGAKVTFAKLLKQYPTDFRKAALKLGEKYGADFVRDKLHINLGKAAKSVETPEAAETMVKAPEETTIEKPAKTRKPRKDKGIKRGSRKAKVEELSAILDP